MASDGTFARNSFPGHSLCHLAISSRRNSDTPPARKIYIASQADYTPSLSPLAYSQLSTQAWLLESRVPLPALLGLAEPRIWSVCL